MRGRGGGLERKMDGGTERGRDERGLDGWMVDREVGIEEDKEGGKGVK